MMIRKEEAGEWLFQFRKTLFDWEIVELSRLVSQIEAGPNLRCCSKDTLVWKASESRMAWRVWYEMIRWWKIQGALPASVEDMLEWWAGVGLNKKEMIMCNAIPLVVMWSLWKHWNECLFQEVVPSVDGITDLIKLKMAVWFKEVFKEHMLSVHDFIFNLQGIRFSLGGGFRE
ncbi:hypothetical protein ACSBR1_027160 [Camellia fascicularis]